VMTHVSSNAASICAQSHPAPGSEPRSGSHAYAKARILKDNAM